MTQAEFTEGQVDFFKKNCHAFEETEENKHEYKDLHEEYIVLCETAIDAVIKAKFSEDEIQAFYVDFSENYDNYKGQSDDAFLVMNALIDFQKFKEQMLEYKKGVTDEAAKDQEKLEMADDGLSFQQLMKEDFNNPTLGWSKAVQFDKGDFGGSVMRRPIEGKKANLLKIDLKFKNTKIEHMLEMMKNGPPLENCIERRRVKEISDDECLIYIKLKLGGFMSTRDNLIKKTVQRIDDGSVLITFKSTGTDEVPEQPGVVRIEMFKAQLYKQDPANPDDLLIEDFTTMDMKGNFPMRIMNMMIGTMMPKSAAKMYGVIQEIKKNNGVLPKEHE